MLIMIKAEDGKGFKLDIIEEKRKYADTKSLAHDIIKWKPAMDKTCIMA